MNRIKERTERRQSNVNHLNILNVKGIVRVFAKPVLFICLLSSTLTHSALAEKISATDTPTEQIQTGAGHFPLAIGNNQTIDIHYYKPKSYNSDSPILVVIPGGKRNAAMYRNNWKKKSEQYGILILSPHYPEASFSGPSDYNLGGMLNTAGDLQPKNDTFVDDKQQWIFKDFDLLFAHVVEQLGSHQSKYDLFGHSAGGQVVHRFVLFSSSNKLNRAIAANSGWYTVPDKSTSFPFGLKGTQATDAMLKNAFSRNLTVFLGEKDNERESRGHRLDTPETLRQGSGRFARGLYFFEAANKLSEKLGIKSAWKVQVVKGVGHSFRDMGDAAADYLYGINNATWGGAAKIKSD